MAGVISRRVFCLCAMGQQACDMAVFRRLQRASGELERLRPRVLTFFCGRWGRCASGLCMDMISAIVLGRNHAPCFDNHCKGFILLLGRLLHAIAYNIQRGQNHQKPPKSRTAGNGPACRQYWVWPCSHKATEKAATCAAGSNPGSRQGPVVILNGQSYKTRGSTGGGRRNCPHASSHQGRTH